MEGFAVLSFLVFLLPSFSLWPKTLVQPFALSTLLPFGVLPDSSMGIVPVEG